MQPTQFTDAVKAIILRNARYEVGGYFFLKEALDFTVKRVMENNDGEHRHVAASELLTGFSDFALQEFGPMASTMMREWGLESCTDIGTMVFSLIEEGVFGKQDSDTLEDFTEFSPLLETLDAPFMPKVPFVRPSQKKKPSAAAS